MQHLTLSVLFLAAAGQNEKPSPIRSRARVDNSVSEMKAPPDRHKPESIPQGPNTGTACFYDSSGKLTAIHPSISVGSRVKVTNLRNHKMVVVTISGHAALTGRLISVSRDAAGQLGFLNSGTAPATVEVVP